MAFTITSRYSASYTTGTPVQTRATGSFTPAANSKLYVVAWCQKDSGTNDLTLSANTGGLTFTRLAQSAEAPLGSGFGGLIAIFEADVGGSPAAMTATVDAGASTQTGHIALGVFDVTGTSPSVKSGQIVANSEADGGGNTETHTTGSLPSAATSGNLCVLCFGCNGDSNGASATPSGWTSLFATSANYEEISCFYRTNFTGSSETCTDLGQAVNASGSILMELQEGGGGGGAVLRKNSLLRVGVGR